MISSLHEKVESDLTASDVEVGGKSEEDLRSQLAVDYIPEERPDEPELSCSRKVKMESENVRQKKKEIKMYENEEKEQKREDRGGAASRNRSQPGEEVRRLYAIRKLEASEETEPEERRAPSTYHISTQRKEPIAVAKISTMAISSNTLRSYKAKDKTARSPFSTGKKKDHETERSSEGEGHKHDRLVCGSCKGFYCRECKSTIPPIYRPIPDANGKYHIHPEAEAKALEFYQKHYYGHDENICKNCEGLKMP